MESPVSDRRGAMESKEAYGWYSQKCVENADCRALVYEKVGGGSVLALGVCQSASMENIMWEGDKIVIEGTTSFRKAAEEAFPFLVEKKNNAAIMLAALDGDEKAERIVAYQNQEPQHQVHLLKEWNASEGELKAWAEVIVNGR